MKPMDTKNSKIKMHLHGDEFVNELLDMMNTDGGGPLILDGQPENCIVGMRLDNDISFLLDCREDYTLRKVFSVEEGNCLTLFVETSMDRKTFMSKWRDGHRVTLQVDDCVYEQTGDFQCKPLKQENTYLVYGPVSWTGVVGTERMNVSVHLYIGSDDIPHHPQFLFDMIPAGIRNDIQMLDMHLTTEYCDERRYGFGENEKEQACIWITCKNTFPDWIVDNLLVDAEIMFINEQGQIVHRMVTNGFPVDEENIVAFYEDFSMTSWPNDFYMITVNIWGRKVAESIFYVGKTMSGNITMNDYTKTVKPDNMVAESVFVNAKDAVKKMSAVERIRQMVGLTEVKKMLAQNLDYVRMMDERKKAGLPTGNRLMHVIMSGAPGTGKTTVARLLGAAYKEMGILSKGHTVECNRASLISDHIGGTEKATMDKLHEAKGGVLFIDEAYSLLAESPTSNDFGVRIIDTLMTVLSDPEADILVVLAGYKDEMKKLMDSNPGLNSRFPVRLDFPDYTVDELLMMVDEYFKVHRFTADAEVMLRIRKVMEKVSGYRSFGAGRFVKTLIENTILPNMATRLFKEGDAQTMDIVSLTHIHPQDVPEPEEVAGRLKVPVKKVQTVGFR